MTFGSGFSFGNNNKTNIFGGTSNNTGGGLFGSSNNNNTSAFGNNNNNTSVFGQTNTNSGGLFGSSSNTNTGGLFGSSSNTNTNSGFSFGNNNNQNVVVGTTGFQFSPPVSAADGSRSSTGYICYMNIACMSNVGEKKSPLELRYDDYKAGKKEGSKHYDRSITKNNSVVVY